MPKKKQENSIVKVNVTRLNKDLKEKLDKIDDTAKKEFIKGYYESRLRIEMSMWKKGKAIDKYVKNRGVNFTLSYYRLEKETGRSRPSLKKWHELYLKHREMNAYKQIAEKKAKDWTNNAYEKFMSKSELTDNETKQLPEDTEKDEYYDEVIRLKFEEMSKKDQAKSTKAYNAYISICDDSIKLYDTVMAYRSAFGGSVCGSELEKLSLLLNRIHREENKRTKEIINQN